MVYDNLKFIKSYIITFIFICLLLYLSLFKIEYTVKHNVIANIENNQAHIYVPYDMVEDILDKPLLFKDEVINYEVISISENMYQEEYVYQELVLEILLDEKYLMDNNNLSLTFHIKEEYLIDKLNQIIKKGIGL